MSITVFTLIPGVEARYPENWNNPPLNGQEPGGGFAMMSGATPQSAQTDGYGVWLEYQRDGFGAAQLHNYGLDFYDRIHINPSFIDLGNVIGVQERTFRIWNAYRRAQPMPSIATEGTEGIALSGQPAPPLEWGPLQEREYTITVTTTGPASINALYTWAFEPYDITLEVVGSRVTAWTMKPDWTKRILERMEWRTDVIQHYRGSEQRRSVRLAPRKYYEFDVFFNGRDRRVAENTVWGWGARNWALPIWPDGQELEVDIQAGATAIAVSTKDRDFTPGGFVMMIEGVEKYEIAEVAEVLDGQIGLVREINQTWPAGAMIYPARLARLNPRTNMPRWDHQGSYMRAAFDLEGTVDSAESTDDVMYRDHPVLTEKPNWIGGFDLEMQRKMAILDNITGTRAYEDEADMPLTKQVMRWMFSNRAEREAFRQLAYRLKGRFKGIWVPTWMDDFIVVDTIAQSSQTIDVEWCNFTKMVGDAPGRKDVRIELFDGTVFYRRITAAQEISDNVERLGIDAPLGIDVPPTEIQQVCFLSLLRLDSDTVEISHWTGETSESTTVLKGYKHDL